MAMGGAGNLPGVGGGSSMGYKRAGYEVVAANDIDPQMLGAYQRNLPGPLMYTCPIGDLLTTSATPGHLMVAIALPKQNVRLRNGMFGHR